MEAGEWTEWIEKNDTRIAEKYSGDDFVVGEPPLPKPKTYHVKVHFDPETGVYTAKWGLSYSAQARSMATSLAKLADALAGAGLHGSVEEKFSQYRRDADTNCKYCEAPIFFGILPSGKYLAFDVEPFEASAVRGQRFATFPRMYHTSYGEKPMAEWTPRAHGPVWIPHPPVCGDKFDEPEHDLFKVRWRQNKIASARRHEKIVQKLQTIHQKIERET